MPEGSHNRIRSVNIYHHNCDYIEGFSFFDKDRKLLCKIGGIEPWMTVDTVLIAENEVIVGVVAKLYPGYQDMYTDFQFQIGVRWE